MAVIINHQLGCTRAIDEGGLTSAARVSAGVGCLPESAAEVDVSGLVGVLSDVNQNWRYSTGDIEGAYGVGVCVFFCAAAVVCR